MVLLDEALECTINSYFSGRARCFNYQEIAVNQFDGCRGREFGTRNEISVGK